MSCEFHSYPYHHSFCRLSPRFSYPRSGCFHNIDEIPPPFLGFEMPVPLDAPDGQSLAAQATLLDRLPCHLEICSNVFIYIYEYNETNTDGHNNQTMQK